MGFRHAAVGALVRSSYHADRQAEEVLARVRSEACGSGSAPRRSRATGSTSARPASSAPPAARRRRRSPRRNRRARRRESRRRYPAPSRGARAGATTADTSSRETPERREESSACPLPACARAGAARRAFRSARRSRLPACQAPAAALRGRKRSSDSRREAPAAFPDCGGPTSLMPCIDALSSVSSPRSIRTRPIERKGWPFWSA